MRAVTFLACLALASASPLGWSPAGSWFASQGGSAWGNPWQQWWGGPSPARQASHQIGKEIQQAQIENAAAAPYGGAWGGSGAAQAVQEAVAQEAARRVVAEAVGARQGQTIEGIQELSQHHAAASAGVGPHAAQQQIATAGAIGSLQGHLQFQQAAAPFIVATSQLAQTLENAIQAQLASDQAEIQQVTFSGQSSQTPSQSASVFQTRVQKLIDQTNIQEIQAEIARQQAKAQQLQQQEQFVKGQTQQIQAQQAIAQQQGQGPAQAAQLQQAQQQLQLQEQQLVSQQLARQLVIQQLQQALVEQQRELQRDTASEYVNQQVAEASSPNGNPWALGGAGAWGNGAWWAPAGGSSWWSPSGMAWSGAGNLWSQAGTAAWAPYGNPWASSGSPWASYGSPWAGWRQAVWSA